MFCVVILVLTQVDTTYNLRDFRIPEVGAMSIEVNGGLSLSHGQDLEERYAYHGYDSLRDISKTTYGGGFADCSWVLNLLGESRYFRLQLVPQFNARIYYLEQDEYRDTLQYSEELSDISQEANLLLITSMGWYLGQSPFLLGFHERLLLGEATRSEPELVNLRGSGDLFLETGIGKIRNVSPADKAWQFLEEIGSANRDNITALSELLAKEWRYALLHWRYKKFFYRDVENLLNENGINLSAYELMRLEEIDYSLGRGRLSGARLKLGAGGYASGITVSPAARLLLDGGYPLSRRWQLSYSGESQLLFDDMQEWLLTNSGLLSLEYYIGDSWSISTSVDGDFRNLIEAGGIWLRDYSVYVVPVGVNFYVEDKLKVGLQLFYDLNGHNYSNGHETYQYLSFSAGLTWRLR